MNEPLVSIVIPAYNSEKTILASIKASLAQSYSNIEVIVVDDGSVDATASIVRSIGEVKYIRQDNRGPASARNRGAAAARGDIIFFTDSDCVPEKDWVKKMVSLLSSGDKDLAVVAGSYGIVNRDSMLARCIYKEILFRHKYLVPSYPRAFGSYNFCIWARIFKELGGFNTDYRYASGEDNDLSYKVLEAGYKILFIQDVVVSHYFPTSVRKYLKEQFRHGFWRVKMYMDHPHMMKGDDYTFWKDIIEPPAVLFFLLSFILSYLFFLKFFILTVCIFTFLFLLNIVFSMMLTKNFYEIIFLSLVMLSRAFARTFGFSSGIVRFFLTHRYKNFK